MVKKIVRDGTVAVAVSGGYGAGWSTWNHIDPMDARFNQLFLERRVDEIVRICEEEQLGYAGGADNVHIVWVPVGTKFVIDEYDGAECIMTHDDFNWRTA